MRLKIIMRGTPALILSVMAGCSCGTVWDKIRNPDFPSLIEEVESCPDACGQAYFILSRVNIPREYWDQLLAISADKNDKGNQLIAFRLLAMMGDFRVVPYIKERQGRDSENKAWMEDCLACLEETPYLKLLLHKVSVGKYMSSPVERDIVVAETFIRLCEIRSKKAVKYMIPCLDDQSILPGDTVPIGRRRCDLALYVIESTVLGSDCDYSRVYRGYMYSEDEIKKWKEWWRVHKDDSEYQ